MGYLQRIYGEAPVPGTIEGDVRSGVARALPALASDELALAQVEEERQLEGPRKDEGP